MCSDAAGWYGFRCTYRRHNTRQTFSRFVQLFASSTIRRFTQTHKPRRMHAHETSPFRHSDDGWRAACFRFILHFFRSLCREQSDGGPFESNFVDIAIRALLNGSTNRSARNISNKTQLTLAAAAAAMKKIRPKNGCSIDPNRINILQEIERALVSGKRPMLTLPDDASEVGSRVSFA